MVKICKERVKKYGVVLESSSGLSPLSSSSISESLSSIDSSSLSSLSSITSSSSLSLSSIQQSSKDFCKHTKFKHHKHVNYHPHKKYKHHKHVNYHPHKKFKHNMSSNDTNDFAFVHDQTISDCSLHSFSKELFKYNDFTNDFPHKGSFNHHDEGIDHNKVVKHNPHNPHYKFDNNGCLKCLGHDNKQHPKYANCKNQNQTGYRSYSSHLFHKEFMV